MQLSPSTISTLIAVLSAQNIKTTGEQLSALLAPLTGTTAGTGPNTLQPGEIVNVMNHNTDDFETYDTLEAAQKEIAAYLEERSCPQDYTGEIEVHIVRKRLYVTCNTVVSFE
jgi:hypothetical protein